MVKGPSIFSGYWAQPELTSVKLQDGWLHTGDMVYQGGDGLLYIAGRKDDMIIRGGMNIYPVEIEDVLLRDPRIREAVVYGVPDTKFGHKLIITVVPQEDCLITPSDVLQLCREHLASYQYPDDIQIVDAMERNATGKTLRKRVI
ncbi:class I adenylate-forming enzyme family protein [Paenibacillus hexagrammi]|uniref:Fatty acid--CoA ligase family protein n=1 Tax=Paenibacillus hexagrammi TaxID=2908839 RepID=A0ABY3SBI6_9BACL|nr:fatty acid--CoA ligase family protein [Paenibacillus sp. YPD9-1]UJF31354.1 fatty acid--CoA ligase family protein [Paenibacillus sp. YPD9-1]